MFGFVAAGQLAVIHNFLGGGVGSIDASALLCGELSVGPLLTGIASVSPLLVGETTVTPLLTGTIEISECC